MRARARRERGVELRERELKGKKRGIGGVAARRERELFRVKRGARSEKKRKNIKETRGQAPRALT